MALVTAGRLWLGDPNLFVAAQAADTATNWQINSSGARFGFVFQVPRSGTISKLGVRMSSVQSAVLSRLGLYTVDSNGFPTTTAYGGSAYGTFTPKANTFTEVTLATAATASAGEMAAVVCEFNSTAGNYYLTGWAGGNPTGFPYQAKYSSNNKTWTKNVRANPGAFSVAYSDGTYPELGSYPLSDVLSSISFNSGSTPNEYALKLNCPFTARCAGLWHLFNPLAGADYSIRVYKGSSLVVDQAISGNASRTSGLGVCVDYFPTPVILLPGNTYYLSILARTTNSLTARSVSLPSAAMVEQVGYAPGLAACQATRSNGGTWLTNPAQLPAIGLLLDAIDDGTGGTPPPPTFSGAPFSRIFTEF